MLVSLLVVPLAILHLSLLSLPPSAWRIASRFERFTQDPEEGSCAIGTVSSAVSSELLCRFGSWSSRASSAPVSRSLSQQATSCQVPSEEELLLCIPQSANLCGIAHPDTSLQPGVRQSHSVINARALFNSHKFDSGSSNGLTRHSP